MESNTVRSTHSLVPVAVVAVGILIAVLPLLVLPESSGPGGFALGFAQGAATLVGLGSIGAGTRSHRTGDRRLAVAAMLTILGLGLVGAVGGCPKRAAVLSSLSGHGSAQRCWLVPSPSHYRSGNRRRAPAGNLTRDRRPWNGPSKWRQAGRYASYSARRRELPVAVRAGVTGTEGIRITI